MNRTVTIAGFWVLGAVALVVAPASVQAGEVLLEQSAGARVILTDNVDLAPDDEKRGAIINRVESGTVFSAAWRRLQVSVNSSIGLESENGQSPRIDQNIRARSSFDIIDNNLFLDASASSSRTFVGFAAAVPGDRAGSEDQTTTVNTFQVSPTGRIGFADDSEAALRLSHREVFTGETGLGDGTHAREMQQTLTVDTRREFRRVGFGLTLDHRVEDRDDDDGTANDGDLEELLGSVTGRFALDRWIIAIARAGYTSVDIDGSDDLSGPFWDVGVQLNGSRGSLLLSYGQRYDDHTLGASVDYQISPRLTVDGALTRNLSSSLLQYAKNRNERESDPVVDLPDAGLASTSANGGTALTYDGRLGVTGDFDRDSVRLGMTFVNREFVGGTADSEVETTLSGSARWSHDLSRDYASSIGFTASYSEGTDVAPSTTLSIRTELSYALGKDVSVFGGVSRAQRFSTDPDNTYTENTVFFGGRLTF